VRLDDRVTIATPEGVTLELVLAGLGSRFVARLLDTVVQLVIIIALVGGAALSHPPGAVLAFIIVATFLVVLAYDIPFELLNDGRTLGKMTAGIRVVDAGGEPISFLASVMRNILRIIDFLPVLYAIGATSIVITKSDQRLGDLAAATVVVRDKFPGVDTTPVFALSVPVEQVAAWDVSAVETDELATIRQFLDRRYALTWPVRIYFANAIASRIGSKIAGAPAGAHPEYLLEGVVVAKQQRA
jgi:uncharacterized RDD family membrane protein YckC